MLDKFILSIQKLDHLPFWIIFTIIIIGCLYSWVSWYKRSRNSRLIEDVPTSKIRSAAQGYVELIGHAEFIQNDVIRSPLSGRECVWYRYEVQEKKRDIRGNVEWQVVEKKESDDIFVLEDDTDKCIVDPTGADVITYEKESWSGQSRLPGVLPHSKKKSLFSGHSFRYKEEWIDAGEILYAIGDFETEGTGEDIPDLRDEVREILRHWKTNSKHYLKKFDINNDGKIDLEEWEMVKLAAEEEALKNREQSASLGVAHIMREPKNQPYILSSLSHDELVKHFRNSSRWILALAIVLGGINMFLINIRFLNL